MTDEKLNQLYNLLNELKDQRIKELDEKHPEKNVYSMSNEELYDLDDCDCLIEHIDAIKSVLDWNFIQKLILIKNTPNKQ